MPRHWSRTLFAVIVAPLLGGATGSVIFLAIDVISDNGVAIATSGEGILLVVLVGLFLGATVGIPLMATLGLLVHRWFCMIGWTRWWHYMLAGTIGGMLPGAATLWSIGDFFDKVFYRSMLMLMWMSGGAIAGGFVWLIRRPDRDGCDAGRAGASAELHHADGRRSRYVQRRWTRAPSGVQHRPGGTDIPGADSVDSSAQDRARSRSIRRACQWSANGMTSAVIDLARQGIMSNCRRWRRTS